MFSQAVMLFKSNTIGDDVVDVDLRALVHQERERRGERETEE